MPRLPRGGALAALLLISAPGCSAQPDEPGAVTADEDRQLNEAAAMLDTNSVSVDALSDDETDGNVNQ